VRENDNAIKIPADQTRMLACDWLESTTNPHPSAATPMFSFFILSLSISCMYYHPPFFLAFFLYKKRLFPSLLNSFAHGQKNCAKLDAWNGKRWKWKGCVGLDGGWTERGGWKFYGTKRSNFWRCFMSWMGKLNGADPARRKVSHIPSEKK